MVSLQNLQNEYLKKEQNNIQSRLINDTIYQHIEYTKLEDKILQTKILSRLQFITQNALAYFSYPSITTRRFIHSIGTMHVSSYMLKNAFLNADKKVKNSFLKELKLTMKEIIKEENLDISLDGNINYFDNKALFQFSIPFKNDSQKDVYTIILQALRLAGLFHDVGHLPFSHQVENALKKLYINTNANNIKEKEFKTFYKEITKDGEKVLHEAIGNKLVDILFDYELLEDKQENASYLKLLHKLIKYILEEKVYEGFDFKVLHQFISSTVDADRLDYINRDMLASGYIGGPTDYLRITKHCILVKDEKKQYQLSFFDMGLIDIEHLLEMRFNLYKKVIYNFGIAKTDALLENVVLYLGKKYFSNNLKKEKKDTSADISMLWKFFSENNKEKKLDLISSLDENWLITLFKKEYLSIKHKKILSQDDKKYLLCFEEVLFGKRVFKAIWKNLNQFYNILDFTTIQRYKFRESFGYITYSKRIQLQKALEDFIIKYENEKLFISYQIVSFSLGVDKDFNLYDGEHLIKLDQISTLRKRLKQSMSNTVPFYLYINKKNINTKMKEELKEILFKIFI